MTSAGTSAAMRERKPSVSMTSQNRSEHHMAKFTGERGDMWTPIPYSVLEDDEFTESVGPIRGGSTSLPGKTAKYTTTRGKLTQDECNAAAREFSSTLHDLRHYDDDTWVKHHPDDPRAQELYRAAQRNSIRQEDGEVV